ncbi:ABC transporter permease [Flavisolibacter nicotianae]|uniref:ABC transporter permease n=1 Tax=Flavisolibacter nicotianae TaxID=2364882 RepID=UPI000EB07C44|nr:FtsX-like permease family protein [Flavisolibacter nicotianae]
MLRNYFKIALRHLQKNKLYALVNIFGLSIGIASCLLIGLYIWHELSFDRFHKNADRIARVTWQYNFGDAENKTATTGTRVGPDFQRHFPEVEAYVRLLKYPRVVRYENAMFDEKAFLYADSAFFSLFSFPLLKGDPKTVLAGPDKVVITASAAKKYFGNEDPVGKTVNVGGTKDFVVTGVAKDAPAASQIRFDFVGTFSSLGAAKEEKWNEANYVTYLLLQDEKSVPVLQNKIDAYIRNIAKNEMQLTGPQYMAYHLEPLTRVHLHSELDGFEPNNNILYIYIMAAVAVLILLIACVNYTNLSTAQSARRSAEISMRKVMGAGRGQVFRQFIIESFLLTLLAVVLALLLSALFLPAFNRLAGKEFDTDILFGPVTLIVLLLAAVVIAFAAGAYPALVLSGSRLISTLKGGFAFTGSATLRKSLIVFQFVISIFLIIATIIILQQLSFIRNKDLGYNKEQVVVLPVDRTISEHYDELKKALATSLGVVSVGGAYEAPTHIDWSDGITTKDGKKITVNALPVDEDFTRTLGLKIIAGEDYSQTDVLQFDTSNGGNNLRYSFMVNESALKQLGWTPEEAIGKTITKGNDGVIKAVVKDFHFRSMHEPINPLLIFYDKRIASSLFVKLSGSNVSATLQNLEKTWKERISHRPFEYHFLDEEYAELYKAEQRTAGVFTGFSSLAILLACLGLFALTAFTMVQRTKEIGIRKVLGATLADILALVAKDFLLLVILALLIAAPLAFFTASKWLDSFSYKVDLHWWVFAGAGVVTILIAFFTISLQAIKTALANPVKNLRTQ